MHSDCGDPERAVPRTLRTVVETMELGLHIGAQVYVSLGGERVAEFAIGEARRGVPMRTDTLMIWFCCSKVVQSIAALQLVERGHIRLDDRVIDYIPEFGARGKEGVTIRQLLTHTAGIDERDINRIVARPWDELLGWIADASLFEAWDPERRATYSVWANWFVLGEIMRRVDGRMPDRYIEEEVFRPLEMRHSRARVPPDEYRAYGDQMGQMHMVIGSSVIPLVVFDCELLASRCWPGQGIRGPMGELGHVLEAMQRGGAGILAAPTVAEMTRHHRVDVYDENQRVSWSWGLGVTVGPEAFGEHCSRGTFGHRGMMSSMAFADPEHELVFAAVTNGMPMHADGAHQDAHHRFRMMAKHVYEDLGLLAAS